MFIHHLYRMFSLDQVFTESGEVQIIMVLLQEEGQYR